MAVSEERVDDEDIEADDALVNDAVTTRTWLFQRSGWTMKT